MLLLARDDPPCEFEACGIPLATWLLQDISRQAEAWRRSIEGTPATADPPLSRKSIWTPRDDYGMKGMRASR